MNIIIAYEQFKKDLVELINNSGLPLGLIQDPLEKTLELVRAGAAQQLQQAKEAEEKANSEKMADGDS